MSTPSSVDSSLWDADNYDLLMKTMTHPPSPPQTSDSECEASSPSSEVPSTPPVENKKDEEDQKKPAKKRKSWGQELPTPTTNLPPRKRAKTEAEKEQRRIERVLRNRAAAHSSRERKRAEQEALEKKKKEIEADNEAMKNRLSQFEQEFADLQKKYKELEHNYLLAKSHLPANSGFVPQSLPEERTISSTSISMSDVQALSPQSLAQSPVVKIEDLSPAVLAKPVLNQTQHHAVSAEQHGGDGDIISSTSVIGDWADWTLFDETMNVTSDFLVDLTGPVEETMTAATTLGTSDGLPDSGLASFGLEFELFGDGAAKKPTLDLDLFGDLGDIVADL